MFGSLALVVVFAWISRSDADGYFPPYITPCHRKDPNLRECAIKQIEIVLPLFTKGIPELDVPSLDPVILDDILVEGAGLNLEFHNATMHGVSKMAVTSLVFDLNTEKFSIGVTGNLSLRANYNINGRVLLVSLRGSGDARVKTKNLEVQIWSEFERYTDASGEHFKLVSPSYKYNMQRAQFHLSNLFNGNKELSEATHQFANRNWKQLMDDLAPPAVKQIVRTCVKAINKFFSKVTIKQILPD